MTSATTLFPACCADGREMYAYHFPADTGRMEPSPLLWEAKYGGPGSGAQSGINLFDDNWKIYSRNSGMTGHKISSEAEVENSMITDGCRIGGPYEVSGPGLPALLWSLAQMWRDAVVMGGTVIRRARWLSTASLRKMWLSGEMPKWRQRLRARKTAWPTVGAGGISATAPR